MLVDDLFSVSFRNENDGWACGRWGTVLHTIDGGKSWLPQDSGTDFTLMAIQFVDSDHGWAVGDQGLIIHTDNGGKTWGKQESPVRFYLMDVYFTSVSVGWIVTEQTHVLNTEDGGETWNIQFADEDFILKGVSFCDAVHGWAVGEYGYICHTDDGGATWEKQGGYFTISEDTGEIEGGTFLFDVEAVDPQSAWAVGIDGYVIRTTDGGETWKEIVTGSPKTQLFDVVSDKRDKILIAGNGLLLTSSDSGKTWQSPLLEPPIMYGWLYGITQRGSSGFAAVGWEGAIYLSTSSRWHKVSY